MGTGYAEHERQPPAAGPTTVPLARQSASWPAPPAPAVPRRRAIPRESWSVPPGACLVSARSIATIAFSGGSSCRSRASLALRLRSLLDKPVRSLMDVLLDALG